MRRGTRGGPYLPERQDPPADLPQAGRARRGGGGEGPSESVTAGVVAEAEKRTGWSHSSRPLSGVTVAIIHKSWIFLGAAPPPPPTRARQARHGKMDGPCWVPLGTPPAILRCLESCHAAKKKPGAWGGVHLRLESLQCPNPHHTSHWLQCFRFPWKSGSNSLGTVNKAAWGDAQTVLGGLLHHGVLAENP